MYKVIELPDDAADLSEQLGTKFKFWARLEGSGKVLFKEGRPNTGENWSEKAACELARLLGLPHAEYELSTWRQKKGVVSTSFVPEGSRLVHGNEVLASVTKAYNTKEFYAQNEHTVRLVMSALKSEHIRMPPVPSGGALANASDVFIGYLMLDAWIGNQDRHHENWGFISTAGVVELAPTFDHASSLGRNETDCNRLKRLTTKDTRQSVEHYVTRARSALYRSKNDAKPLFTLEAFSEAAKHAPDAAAFWRDRLGLLRAEEINNVFEQIPSEWITEPASNFARRMLLANRKRILDEGGA